jgi:glycosyltransferase involved in cell wall biosynthesis
VRLTVITPSFNQASYLERTLRSVLDQSYPDLEYIVVDGGSTDGSVGILERYSDQLAWWVSEPDRGQTHALNKGLERATGDVVAYINSDDYYLPEALATAARALDGASASWVAGACRFEDSEDPRRNHVWRPAPPPRSRAVWLLAPWSVPQPSSFWRRGVFERHGPFRQDLHYAFDTEHTLRLALAGEPPELIPDELAVRYLHGDAKSANDQPFQQEREAVVDLLSGRLTRAERLELTARRRLARLGLR